MKIIISSMLLLISINGYGLTLPFQDGESWYVCQGYRGQITHSGSQELALDMSFSPNSVGNTGCTANTAGVSSNKKVFSPATGTVAWIGYTDPSIMCVNFIENSIQKSMKIGHLNASVSSGDTLTEGVTELGRLRNYTDSLTGGYSHIHIQKFNGYGCVTANQVEIGNSFNSDLSSDESIINQWSGTKLTRNDSDLEKWSDSFGYNAGGWRVEKHPRMVADVNGDGLDDIVAFGNYGTYVSLSTGSNFSSHQKWSDSFGYNAGWRVEKHPRMVADVNGDNLADIIAFGNYGVYVALSTGSSFSSYTKWISQYGYNTGGWRVEKHSRTMADVNGDGLADIVAFGNYGTYVSLSTGFGFEPAAKWINQYGYSTGGWRVEKHPRTMADVNGDGLADIVAFGNYGTYVSLSTGFDFEPAVKWINKFGYSAGGWRVEKHPRTMADVNGDGLADIVAFGNYGVYISLSNGSGFDPYYKLSEHFSYGKGWRVDKNPRTIADANGDGKSDIVGFGNHGVYIFKN